MNKFLDLFERFRPARTARSPLHAEVTISRREVVGDSTITVGLRLEELSGSQRYVKVKWEKAPVFDLDPLVKKLFPTQKCVLRAFYGYGIDGAALAAAAEAAALKHEDRNNFKKICEDVRSIKLRRSGIVFTAFGGRLIGNGWRKGVEIATALACLKATEEPELAKEIDMFGWGEIRGDPLASGGNVEG